MRTWINCASALSRVSLGRDPATEPSYRFVEPVVATRERSSPFATLERSARECWKAAQTASHAGYENLHLLPVTECGEQLDRY
jgi:hypothetical protein